MYLKFASEASFRSQKILLYCLKKDLTKKKIIDMLTHSDATH